MCTMTKASGTEPDFPQKRGADMAEIRSPAGLEILQVTSSRWSGSPVML
jgi:hypothetical protein